MSIASAGYSITMRLYVLPDDQTAVGRITTAIGEANGVVTALDFVEAEADRLVVDVTANARDVDHASELSAAVDEVDGVTVHKVSDRTFLMHLGGKLEVRSRVQLRTRDQLSMAYTPGVARVSSALAERPEDAHNLTIKGNTVAIVTDGSAVLGTGQYRPDCRDACHGGQGGPVQTIRQCGCLADLSRYPGHRGNHPAPSR